MLTTNDSTKTLKEKYDNEVRESKNNLAKLLKRRRIESNHTLEEVSSGICSPSYLSKIENCQVDVDEYYFQSLFAKLQLVYEDIKIERTTPIFPLLLKFYLLGRFNDLDEKIKSVASGNLYCDTELELALLFRNIVLDNLDEAKLLLEKLERVRNTLTKEELSLLVFINTLYLYKTNQTIAAVEQIRTLVKLDYEDELLKTAVLDLSVDIYYALGEETLFAKCLGKLEKSHYIELIMKRKIMHRLQGLTFYDIKYVENIHDELSEINDLIDFTNPADAEAYCYYVGIIYNNLNDYNEALKVINKVSCSDRLLALEAVTLIRKNDFNEMVDFLTKIKANPVKAYNALYGEVIEYVREKIEQYSYNRTFSYLKTILLPRLAEEYHFFYDSFAVAEFAQTSYSLGKYKETVRFLTKINQISLS